MSNHQNPCIDDNSIDKWDLYYINASGEGALPPPWESNDPHAGLVSLVENFKTNSKSAEINSSRKAIELGCGSSASSIFLAQEGYQTVGVDISYHAIERAKKRQNSSLVTWIQADVLADNFLKTIRYHTHHSLGQFDLVFDMQCFHVLRDIDEIKAARVIYALLTPGGHAMIICGAKMGPTSHISADCPAKPGPPLLTKEEVITPFLSLGLELISIEISTFNPTSQYLQRSEGIPHCWNAVFRKHFDRHIL